MCYKKVQYTLYFQRKDNEQYFRSFYKKTLKKHKEKEDEIHSF